MKPVIIHQHTPKGVRILGEKDTLLTIARHYGTVTNLVNVASPYLLFRSVANATYNISYFSGVLMRDVAYWEILNPNRSSNIPIELTLKEYFHRSKKVGKVSTQQEFYEMLQSSLSNPTQLKKFNTLYSYIHSCKCTNPMDYLHNSDGRAALYLYCRDQLGLKVHTRNYTLNLLLTKMTLHGRKGRSS